jgi:hypothetical protein
MRKFLFQIAGFVTFSFFAIGAQAATDSLETPGYSLITSAALANYLSASSDYQVKNLKFKKTIGSQVATYYQTGMIYGKINFVAVRDGKSRSMVCKFYLGLNPQNPEEFEKFQTYDCLTTNWHTLLEGESFMHAIPFSELGVSR